MCDGMRATNKWAALYFIALMAVGYYALFNMLVAVLVEGFTDSEVNYKDWKRFITVDLSDIVMTVVRKNKQNIKLTVSGQSVSILVSRFIPSVIDLAKQILPASPS